MATLPEPTEGLSLSIESYAPLEHQLPHAHDTASITLLLAGALEERAGGKFAHANVFSVVIKPPDCIHEDCFGPAGARTLQLKLSAELARTYTRELNYQWFAGGEIPRAMAALLSEPSPDSHRIWCGFFDILGALPSAGNPRTDRAATRHVRDLAARIEEEPAAGLSVRDVAEDIGMHPVSLARAFRRCHGCSILDFIRRTRIMRACRLLDEDILPLSAIAAEMGFADQAHFTRAFRAETGLPPGAFRKLARPADRR